MPRMLLSLALLCFALPSSSATQTDSHREIVPEIANGTNQDPPDPPKPPQDPRYDPGYPGPGFGIHHPQDPRYSLGYPDPGYGMPPQDPRYDHGYGFHPSQYTGYPGPGYGMPPQDHGHGFHPSQYTGYPGPEYGMPPQDHGHGFHQSQYTGYHIPPSHDPDPNNYPHAVFYPNLDNPIEQPYAHSGHISHPKLDNPNPDTHLPNDLVDERGHGEGHISHPNPANPIVKTHTSPPKDWKTVNKLNLKPGHLYFIRRNAIGLTYFPQENVPVIYIGPVPDFKMLAFLLVLERQRPPPEQYELKNVKECFGKKLPIRLKEDEVAVNFKWAHVAIAQKIKEKTEDSGVELSSSMLETVKSNMEKNYEAREWNWNWKEPGLGQQGLWVPTPEEPFIYRRRQRDRSYRQRKPPKTKRLGG